MTSKITRTHAGLVAGFWIIFTIVATLVGLLVLDLVEESPWPLEDSITVEHTDGTAVRSSSDRVEVSIDENPETNVTTILTSIEFSFNVSSRSRRFSFGMNSTHFTPGSNYIINDYREVVLYSTTDSKSWDLHYEPPGTWMAITIGFEKEYLFNESNQEEFTFHLEWNSTLSLLNILNRTSDFTILMHFAMNLEEMLEPYIPLARLSQVLATVGIGGVLGVISVLILMDDYGESHNMGKSRGGDKTIAKHLSNHVVGEGPHLRSKSTPS